MKIINLQTISGSNITKKLGLIKYFRKNISNIDNIEKEKLRELLSFSNHLELPYKKDYLFTINKLLNKIETSKDEKVLLLQFFNNFLVTIKDNPQLITFEDK